MSCLLACFLSVVEIFVVALLLDGKVSVRQRSAPRYERTESTETEEKFFRGTLTSGSVLSYVRSRHFRFSHLPAGQLAYGFPRTVWTWKSPVSRLRRREAELQHARLANEQLFEFALECRTELGKFLQNDVTYMLRSRQSAILASLIGFSDRTSGVWRAVGS